MRKPLRKFWYAVRTTEQPKGRYFLFVEVVPDGKALAAAAVQIVAFAGDPQPRSSERRRLTSAGSTVGIASR